MGIGSVRLNLIRKWIQDILTGLADLHQKTESHDPIIHGRIRLQHLLYHRSTGQVRIGGYYWLTVASPGQQYLQVKWAEDDCRSLCHRITHRQHRLLRARGVYRRAVDYGRGHLRIGHGGDSPPLRLPPVRRAGRQYVYVKRDEASAFPPTPSSVASPAQGLALSPEHRRDALPVPAAVHRSLCPSDGGRSQVGKTTLCGGVAETPLFLARHRRGDSPQDPQGGGAPQQFDRTLVLTGRQRQLLRAHLPFCFPPHRIAPPRAGPRAALRSLQSGGAEQGGETVRNAQDGETA